VPVRRPARDPLHRTWIAEHPQGSSLGCVAMRQEEQPIPRIRLRPLNNSLTLLLDPIDSRLLRLMRFWLLRL